MKIQTEHFPYSTINLEPHDERECKCENNKNIFTIRFRMLILTCVFTLKLIDIKVKSHFQNHIILFYKNQSNLQTNSFHISTTNANQNPQTKIKDQPLVVLGRPWSSSTRNIIQIDQHTSRSYEDTEPCPTALNTSYENS